ncbi:MAG: DEAD/DEAH box helicase [Verrucomicrobia bacterium]|nr:DEAD/DEAH box helicase [Verrucomicrobiota bacterium]
MPARKSPAKRQPPTAIPTPPAADWRTTDADEINRRIQRARDEKHTITNLHPDHPVFSTFRVNSPSGMTYQVEIRDLATRAFSCTCPDFRSNGLGTCKHAEAVRIWLKRRLKGQLSQCEKSGSARIDIVPADNTLKIERNLLRLPAAARQFFDDAGLLLATVDPVEALEKLRRFEKIRISQDVGTFLEARRRTEERILLRRDYESGVASGRHPEHVTLAPLYPYQREGMLHLAFAERALLADEMGLGKTIQAIAACALLHHLGKASRVLVVTPASLKAEWEEQINRFTTLGQRLIFGPRTARAKYYDDGAPPFFTIVNYEQIVTDSLDINASLKPDIIVLDEAQRIKNWATKTAQAVKRLDSRYAFVLTGTPIENRIDELYSIVDFLDPALLGPLFRFNREFYQFDERGRPSDYQNLTALRERIRPILLRRRKAHVETEIPDRTDRHLFVKLTPAMQVDYDSYKQEVSRLLQIALRRPLTKQQQDHLMILLGIMRMICDSPSIVKTLECEDCPKLAELARVLDECLSDPDVKVIIFSEWEGMLKKVRAWAEKHAVGYAWHTGSVPQKRRRGEIIAFRDDPACRLFLSTDSGGVGLNLQVASVVINCDLPWNPAKLEQRIARAWRKHQRRAVTVINLIAENSIEHTMLETLANKSFLAEGVLDGGEGLSKAKLKRGSDSHLARLQQMLAPVIGEATKPLSPAPPADPAKSFAEKAAQLLGRGLLHCHESFLPGEAAPVLLAVVTGLAQDRQTALADLHRETQWGGSIPALHVLDEATWATLQHLAASGLITLNARATRPLTVLPPLPEPPPLTSEQLQRIADLRTLAAKQTRVAKLLIAEDLTEEAIPHQHAADLAIAQAHAIENRLPVPEQLEFKC